MKITLLQTDIKWASPAENILSAERLLTHAAESDLYVLPETWSTGFVTGNPDDDQHEALQWMHDTARRLDAAVCGSLAVKLADGRSVNRQYFVKPDGTSATYDKHHLFRYGGEDRHYSAGNERTVVEWRGVRWLLVTCYDLRFPVWLRYREDYDGIICVANWPESRHSVWHTLLRARAIENQCFVVGCNRVGDDPNCHYIGHSAIIDSRGNAIAEDESGTETTVTAEIDMQKLAFFREKFRVLSDRDIFDIKIQN